MKDCMRTDHHDSDHESLAKNIGQRLRTIRKAKSKSLIELASVLGVSYQQVQKYETGVNRISAGSLFIAAQFLGCKVEDFYVDVPQSGDAPMDTNEVIRLGLLVLSVPGESRAHLENYIASISNLARAS